ncbi:hypothetical protein K438DRAFT_1781932, partial [Mycena galopus ATCC 62051]
MMGNFPFRETDHLLFFTNDLPGEAYLEHCFHSSLGINRFPAELLVEIFALCWASFTPRFANVGPPEPSSTDVKPPGPSTSEDNESAPLAEDESAPPGEPAGPNVSQVEANLFQDKTTPANMLEVARHRDGYTRLVVRDRARQHALGHPESHRNGAGSAPGGANAGGTLSLDLMLAETDGHTFPSPVLDMLAAHSERWQTLTCPYSALDAFTALRGKLPRLQNLEIDLADWDDPQSLDILRGLPSLMYLSFPALYLADDMGKLPLAQLT